MESFNINVALCELFDEEKRTASNFFNEIILKDNRAKICVFTMVNYVGTENSNIELDYFLQCIDPEDKGFKGARIHLFSIEAKGNKENIINGYRVFESIFAQPKIVSFPTKGVYELQVYKMDSMDKEKANERYKIYKERHIFPTSAYRFFVK